MPREIYPRPVPVMPTTAEIEKLASEGIEVASLEPFTVFIRQDLLGKFPTERELRAYVMKKLEAIR